MNLVNNLMKKNKVFIKYLGSAAISFILDLALFSIFNLVLRNPLGTFSIFVATVIARAISSFINYILNRNKVFKKNENKFDSKTLVKYYFLVLLQMIVSATVVMKLYEMFKVYEILIKVPVEIILFLVNFFVQKFFIFTDKEYKYSRDFKFHSLVCFLLAIASCYSLLYEIIKNAFILDREGTNFLSYFIVTAGLFWFYKKYLGKFEGKTTYRVIALIFSLLMVFGYSYNKVHSAIYVFGNPSLFCFSIVKLIGFYTLFSVCIHLLDNFICTKNLKELKNTKLVVKFKKHPFVYSFIFILICYLPYIIAYYPGIINYDNANQIKEVMGMHTRYLDSINVLNPSVTLTNFNPIIHTLLIGGCFKFGDIIGNVNLGLFMYFIIQLIIVIGCFSYSIYYMVKRNMNSKLILASLLIYSFVPSFPYYAICGVKDVIFSSFVLIYIIKMYDIVKYKDQRKDYFILGIIAILVCLFRNNGFIIILMSLPFLCIFKKKIRKPVLIVFSSVFLIYFGFNKIVLPFFDISNTSVREVLSVPFQQTARHVKYYESDLSSEDKQIIDKILNYETLAKRYDDGLSDPVKNKFNKNTTSDDLIKYFNVWCKYLLKRPVVYIDATINNIYGYFYPNTTSWYVYTKLNQKLPEAGFDYHFNDLGAVRGFLSGYQKVFPFIPIVSLLTNIGMVVWLHILLIGFLIVHKKKKYIVMLIPAISTILMCMAGPVNTYYRYILPLVFALPFIINLVYCEFKNKKESND